MLGKKRLNKIKGFITSPSGIALMFVLALVVGTGMFASSTYIVTGYDGITAQITDVSSGRDADIDVGGANAVVQQHPYWDGFLYKSPAGVVCEIDSAVDVNDKELYDSLEQTIDNGDGTDTVKHWDIWIVHCSMGVTIRTSGGGLDPAVGIKYMIQLSENDFSVFTEYDENYAFILEVYTRNATQMTGIVDVVPSSGGFTFPLITVEKSTVPSWFAESGYNVQSLSRLREVKFTIYVKNIQPTSFLGAFRGESQAVIDIGIDVFLVGMWEKTVQHGWEPPVPQPNWWDSLFAAFGDFAENAQMPFYTIMFVVVVVVIGLVAWRLLGFMSMARRARV